ncbi:MAG: aldehyde dehydrogenase family protein [Trueperaceae bacterium]|nr:aldehyde dehydrogenase family protein [Trueperaceae bacterium]
MLTSTQVLPLYGGGAWFAADSPLVSDVVAPADGEVLARVPWATERDVDAVVGALVAHGTGPRPDRATRLARVDALHGALHDDRDAWADLVAREGGLTRPTAEAEVARALRCVALAREEGRTLDAPTDVPGAPDLQGHRVPIGVVAAVLPASHPASEPAAHVARALAVGAPLVVNPSIRGALAAQWLVETALRTGLPPGALALVHGNRDTADALVAHPDVDAVSVAGPRDDTTPIAARAHARGLPVLHRTPRRLVVWVGPEANLDRVAAALTSALLGPAAGRGLLPVHVLVPPRSDAPLAAALDAAAATFPDPYAARTPATRATLDALTAAYPRGVPVPSGRRGAATPSLRRLPLALQTDPHDGPARAVTSAGLPVVFTTPVPSASDALAALRHWPIVDEVALVGHGDATAAAVAALRGIPLVSVDAPLDGATLAPAGSTEVFDPDPLALETRLMTRALRVTSPPR